MSQTNDKNNATQTGTSRHSHPSRSSTLSQNAVNQFLQDRSDGSWLYRSTVENHRDRQSRVSEVLRMADRLNLANERSDGENKSQT